MWCECLCRCPRPESPLMSRGRSKARRLALQALYQWQMAGQNLGEIEKQFLTEQDIGGADQAYFSELLRNVPQQTTELDKTFGADQSYRYINGVMDKVAHELRAVEIRMKMS